MFTIISFIDTLSGGRISINFNETYLFLYFVWQLQFYNFDWYFKLYLISSHMKLQLQHRWWHSRSFVQKNILLKILQYLDTLENILIRQQQEHWAVNGVKKIRGTANRPEISQLISKYRNTLGHRWSNFGKGVLLFEMLSWSVIRFNINKHLNTQSVMLRHFTEARPWTCGSH